MKNVVYELVNETHITEAVGLVLESYNEQKQAIDFLPEGDEFTHSLQESVTRLFSRGLGLAARVEGKLIGFIVGIEVLDFWGKCKGVYCPLYGHGVMKAYKPKLYQELYKRVASLWVKNQITSHAITLSHYDQETIHTWFWMGFGNRCVDSIRKVSRIETFESGITVKKIGLDKLADLTEVESKLHLYFRASPMFMPREEEDPLIALTNWLKEENHHIWAAYRGDSAVGLMQIEPEGETFVSKHASIMNITGAYVVESERKSGVATLLLANIQNWLIENNYPLCGVDFESFNTDGSEFWNKHFTPYTYSMTRRIDERILEG